jgi:putative transposase
MFYRKLNNKPHHHIKKYSHQLFSIREDRMNIYSDKVFIPGIGHVEVIGDINPNVIGFGKSDGKPIGKFEGMVCRKYINPRVRFNGCKYYLTFSLSQDKFHLPNSCYKYKCNPEWQSKESTDVIGIDVGCKEDNWFTLSDGKVFKRPSQKKLDKRIKGYQKKYARQMGTLKERQSKKGVTTKHLKPTKSMIKTLTKLNKIEKKITNRKKNIAREIGNYLVKKKPKAVVFEDFKITDWNDNIPSNYPTHVKHSIRRVIQDSMLYTARQLIVNILNPNDIPVIYADEEYPSTQLCNNCGTRQKMGIRQRIYKCPCCGMVMDRDLNASINLRHYGESKLGLV